MKQFQLQSREARRDQRTFAEVVVKGAGLRSDVITIVTKEEGNGWIYESVFVKLKACFSFSDLNEEISSRGLKDVLDREGGGKLAVPTFNSKQALNKGVDSLKK